MANNQTKKMIYVNKPERLKLKKGKYISNTNRIEQQVHPRVAAAIGRAIRQESRKSQLAIEFRALSTYRRELRPLLCVTCQVN